MSRGVDRREVAGVVKLRYNDQEPFLAAARRVPTSAASQRRSSDWPTQTWRSRPSRGGGGHKGTDADRNAGVRAGLALVLPTARFARSPIKEMIEIVIVAERD